MRIAFYAPMKPPTSAIPSGDRQIARLLMAALEHAGHEVSLASRFRSFDGTGNEARQLKIKRICGKLGDRLVERYRNMANQARPEVWFTYHVFFKAPDWIGPRVARALGIPYVVAEASFAPKREHGPWRIGHAGARESIVAADLVVTTNGGDLECLTPLLKTADRSIDLAPFLDTAPYEAAGVRRDHHRRALADSLGVRPGVPLLLTVAMMRPGDKVESYRVLAEALEALRDKEWRLVIAGSGPAEDEVRGIFAPIDDRVHWLGRRDPEELPGLYAACDAFLWPALKETPGMCFLEAQAVGTPVIGGRAYGVPAVVADGETGFLCAAGDAGEFADAVARLLGDGALRRSLGNAAAKRVWARHGLDAASRTLDTALGRLSK